MKPWFLALPILASGWLFSGIAQAQGVPGPTYLANSIVWTTTVTNLRGQNGQPFAFLCPPNGAAIARVWGTDIYTDDSSICVAAVHAVVIMFSSGGPVIIEIRPGQSSYTGTTRNGVVSSGYGGWSGSFVFVTAASPPQGRSYTAQPRAESPPPAPVPPSSVTWATTTTDHRGQNGQRFTYACPLNGMPARVWGTDIYTDDSSICTAAVHSGRILPSTGGTVTIEIRPGQPSYMGTGRNGILSESYGAWTGSFIFVGTAGPPQGRSYTAQPRQAGSADPLKKEEPIKKEFDESLKKMLKP